jgi:hypothetical protein
MHAILERLRAHEALLIGLGIASAVMFVGTLVAVPWLIARAPRDILTRAPGARGSIAGMVVRNVLGLLLALMGLLLLVLPGQGILTLLVGVALLDVPGKRALLVRLAKRPQVLRVLNYVRQRAGREPFDAPSA